MARQHQGGDKGKGGDGEPGVKGDRKGERRAKKRRDGDGD